MASGRDGCGFCFAIQASSGRRKSSCPRTIMPTPCPVVLGRPRVSFFGISGIDLAIYSRYHKCKPRGSVNFRPGSNPNHEGINPMIQADSVLSTPPTNTSAIDHPMMFPPRDPTRRRFLTVAAVGSFVGAGSLAHAALAPGAPQAVTMPRHSRPDPVFGLIEAHRKAHAAHVASLELQNRFERRYGSGHGSWISTQPCHDEDDAFEAFVAAPATTIQGLLAKMAYFEELASEFETEWMVYDRVACPALIESFTASLANIIAVQS